MQLVFAAYISRTCS